MATEKTQVGIEARLRDWAFRSRLTRGPWVVRAYRYLNRARFRGVWQKPVQFRGSSFVIGQDLSLFPAVHSGAFELQELDWLLPRVRRDAVAWDVGANIGLYSVLLARAACAGTVTAFEPVPSTSARLKSNLILNQITNVTVVDVALGAEPGEAEMQVYADAPGCNTLALDGAEPGFEILRVHVATADTLIQSGAARPDVVKVDVEGYEPEFFKGARELIEKGRPLLLMEVNGSSLTREVAQREWSQMIDWLFSVYGSATWFGLDGPETVDALPVSRVLDLPRAASLGFQRA